MRILVCFLVLLVLPAHALPIKRCVNLGNGLDAPTEGAWGYRIERHHLSRIAAAGFDTIRLPARISAHWNGQIDPDFLRRLDQVIAWALEDRLGVILDMHHFEPLMAAPEIHAPTFVKIWAQLAHHYRDAPDSLMFELLNEPSGKLTTARTVELFERAVPVIRRENPKRWIILGGGNWSSASELAALPVIDERIAHTFHFYDPWHFTHQRAPWIDPVLPARPWGDGAARKRTLDALSVGLAHRAAPVLLGEFGVYDDVPPDDAVDWLAAVRNAAEEAGVPWCVWSFSSTFRTYETSGDTWNESRLRALIPEK